MVGAVGGTGGMTRAPLFDRIRREAARLANDYFAAPDYATLVVAPGPGDRAGLSGAPALVQRACR